MHSPLARSRKRVSPIATSVCPVVCVCVRRVCVRLVSSSWGFDECFVVLDGYVLDAGALLLEVVVHLDGHVLGRLVRAHHAEEDDHEEAHSGDRDDGPGREHLLVLASSGGGSRSGGGGRVGAGR